MVWPLARGWGFAKDDIAVRCNERVRSSSFERTSPLRRGRWLGSVCTMSAYSTRVVRNLIVSVSILSCVVALPGVAAADMPAPPLLELAAPPADAIVHESGLATKVLVPGTGTEPPGANDVVAVHYTGWTADGEVVDSTVGRTKPTGLPVDKVIPGWAEGLQQMVVGEKRRMWIPEALAFQGREGAPAGMLVFDVELFEIDRRTPPPAPADVAAPPTDAEVMKSGLASRILRPGVGSEHPKISSRVTVHYTGWTTEGEMFDSSITRNQATSFSLRQVIKGWSEGMQLMVVGEKRRFWIPEKLAYKGQRGKPQGMLVFDIELLSFH